MQTNHFIGPLLCFFYPLTVTKYLNGNLDEDTKYTVFQRSYAEDGDYENEGFVTFTTKEAKKTEEDGISTTIVVLSVVVGLLVLLIVVGGIVMWRRFHHNGAVRHYYHVLFLI